MVDSTITLTSSLHPLLQAALDEDIPTTDITSDLLIHTDSTTTATLISKAHGRFFGTQIVYSIFDVLKSDPQISFHCHDGDNVAPQDIICTLTGPVCSLLKAERVMLNFLQHLSGIASTTSQFVSKLDNAKIQICDTRKTTPLLRVLEKQAVLAGGGVNHRHSLSDMVLIKENHISAFLSHHSPDQLYPLIKTFKQQHPTIPVEIEINAIDLLTQFDLSLVDFIMLDNFNHSELDTALSVIQTQNYTAKIEVSGNITLDTISRYRDLPIHRLSIGALTHSVNALDLSLLLS